MFFFGKLLDVFALWLALCDFSFLIGIFFVFFRLQDTLLLRKSKKSARL